MRLFVEVARTKSFRRAAEALDMPNSTLSRHIAELEKTIGLQLLHRSTRKVELTAAGEVYFKRCQSIVEEARMAHESLVDVVERPSGTLRVDLQSEPFDLAIRIGPSPTAPSTLVARQIGLLPRYLYASPAYLKAAPPLNHPDDLIHHVVCVVQGVTNQEEVQRTFYRSDEAVDVTIASRF